MVSSTNYQSGQVSNRHLFNLLRSETMNNAKIMTDEKIKRILLKILLAFEERVAIAQKNYEQEKSKVMHDLGVESIDEVYKYGSPFKSEYEKKMKQVVELLVSVYRDAIDQLAMSIVAEKEGIKEFLKKELAKEGG